jgi:hypothetical protein
VEQARKELERLQIFKEHPQVVRERDELRKSVSELKFEISEKDVEIASLKEVAQIVGEEKITLSQLLERFKKTREEEIQSKAKEQFNIMKKEWEQGEKKKDVQMEAIAKLKAILFSEHGYRSEANEADLVVTVLNTVADRINKGINDQFNRRVEIESNRKAEQKVKETLTVEWPNWYKTNVEPRAKELEDKFINNALRALQGPWEIICTQCGKQTSNRQFTPLETEKLLRDGAVMVQCPSCGYRKRLVLRELIESLMISARP